MTRTLEAIANDPWLITEQGIRKVVAVAERAAVPDVEALARYESQRLDGTARVQDRNGTAIIPVRGPIFRYANLFTNFSGGTSTQTLATDFTTALEDESIREILLDIDSPGGAAKGINELAQAVYDARGRKPIVAYSGGEIASAAYWIGSAADRIVIDRITLAGSIGAVMTILDSRERDKKLGMREIELVSSQSPDKRIDHDNNEGRAKLQKIVDDLGAVFVESVAMHRGVDVETVLSDYGRGGILVGQNAVDAGLVDELGSLETVIAQMQAAREPTQRRSFFFMNTRATQQASANKGPTIVRNQGEYLTALSAGVEPSTIQFELPDVAKLTADAKSEGIQEQKLAGETAIKAAREEATLAERNRIVGLRAISMKGFEKEIEAAIGSGATVEATAVKIAQTGASRGTTIASQQTDASKSVQHGGAADIEGTEATASKGGAKPWAGVTGKLNSRNKRSAQS